MKNVIPIIFMMVLLSVVPTISSAEPTQQFNKIFLDPFYRQSMTQDVPYSYEVTIDPPDDISQVVSAIITYQMWLNPTIEFFLDVNGQTCNTPSYEVHTTYAGAGEGTIFFDCSNIINSSGTYNVTLTPDDDTGAITGWVDLTYMNDPRIEVAQIGGTEYSAEESARTVIHILDNQGQPLNSADCRMTVRDSYNNIKVDNQTLSYVNSSNGLYSYEFVSALPYGVYSLDTVCNFNGTNVYSADTFHVAQWTKDLGNSGGSSSNQGYELRRVSGTEYWIGETAHVIVQVLQNGLPDNTAQCSVDIFSPDASDSDTLIKVIEDADMDLVTDSNGIFRYNFNDTNFTGSYVADTFCTAESIGIILNNHTNNVTDSTTSSTPIEISGSSITLDTLLDGVPIVAFMSIEGTRVGGDGTGQYELSIDGLDYELTREFQDDEEGNIFMGHINTGLTAGTHTISANHNTTGDTLNSRINLLAFGLEDNFIQVPYCNSLVTDTITETTSPMNDIPDVNCTLDLTQESNVFLALSFSAESSVAGKTGAFTISIDGVDQETQERSFGNANERGALSFITLSNSELTAGTHEFKGRWGAIGGTITGSDFQLIVFSNQAGNRKFSMEEDTLATSSTTANSPADIGSNVPVTINDESTIAGFLSLSAETSSANKKGYFSVNIDDVDGVDFARHFAEKDKSGSISVVQTSDSLTTGFYNTKGRWFVDSTSISGTNIQFIGIGFTTTTDFAPQYIGLDFVVNNETAQAEFISDKTWNYDGTIANNILSQFVSAIWGYNGTIINNILTQISDTIWTRTDRNLTFYPSENVTVQIDALDIAENVWNYTNRNLTFHPNGTASELNISEFAEAVWNVTNRTVNTETLWVGGTEYSPDETTGKVVVRIVQDDKNPVTGANCSLYVFYPNNTLYLNAFPMIETNASLGVEGIYYADFPHSEEIGVHPYGVDCVGGGKEYFLLDTYHVFGANETKRAEIFWNYSNRSLTEFPDFNITIDNNITLVVNETTINLTTINVTVQNVTVIANNTMLNITVQNQTVNVNDINLTVLNQTVQVNNVTINLTTENVTVQNVTIIANNTLLNLTVQNTTVQVNNFTITVNQTDVNLTVINQTVSVNNVSFNTSDVATQVWNYQPNRNLTFYDKDNITIVGGDVNATTPVVFLGGTEYNLGEETRIAVRLIQEQGGASAPEVLASCNISIIANDNSVIFNQTPMTEFADGVYFFDYNNTLNGVHTYYTNCGKENRTYFALNTFHVGLINETSISDSIWTRNDRNLSYYPSENLSDLTLDGISDSVWNATDRNLTYYQLVNVSNLTVNVNASDIASQVWNWEGGISNNILSRFADKIVCELSSIFNREEEWRVHIKAC